MKQYIFGVDLGGTTIKLGIFTGMGELLHKWEIPTDTRDRGSRILGDIAVTCRETADRKGYPFEEFAGLGIGIPGTVDREGNVYGCVNLGWGYTRVRSVLEDLLGLPVRAGNDADVATLGEMWQGAGKGCGDLVMFTLGTGVGGGVISGGNLIRGAHGFGAEIGHMCVCPDEKEYCNCGKRGCLEQYCSASGIVHQTELALSRSDRESILRQKDPLTAKDIFDACKAGDAFAMERVDRFGRLLALGMSYVASVTDPEIIVIGGGVSAAGTILTEAVRRHYGDFSYGRQKEVRFVLAELGNDAGIYGSAGLFI